MKTITITLSVPDDVAVQVGPAELPILPAGWPRCPVHDKVRLVQAGVSTRTGQAYPAFYSCEVRECRWRADVPR